MIAALRAWARRHTERSRYSPVGIVFHWVMAALVLFQLGWGWYTGFLAAGGDKLAAYRIHSDVGLLILLLAIGRFAWRLIIPGPINDADLPGIQSKIAYATHYVFYICFFGLPLSGWAMWSALGENAPLAIAGLVPWPALPFEELPSSLQWAIMDYAEDVHHLLVLTLAGLVPLHVAAALKHHFWDRHDVLRGMIPEVPDEESGPQAPKHKPRPIESRPA
ncbi:cytochrome b [Sphingosinicella sp. CPCC 101087]|uniref:cytochrome b n=1 Tax=Sphingosinicella sp. CPCC 101087 TaxID=2497754 RepID=UPI00101BD2C6|nr:cytochrome b [Sphingosinicella sp. CPCC 101087]